MNTVAMWDEQPGQSLRIPLVGERVYVPDFLYLHHSDDNFRGGCCIISRVVLNKELPSDHSNYCMIEVGEDPGALYNWLDLSSRQDELAATYSGKAGFAGPGDGL